ncbi:hypothetical protein BH23PSE1_BH23PSE1_15650 [soil metagenome]
MTGMLAAAAALLFVALVPAPGLAGGILNGGHPIAAERPGGRDEPRVAVLATARGALMLAQAPNGERPARAIEARDPGAPTEAVATWHQHLVARRIAMPGADCPNQAFGVCDRDFPDIFASHGMAPFPLYRSGDGCEWYADRDNVGRAAE